MDIRCPSRIVGIITDEGLLEVKCSSGHCKKGNAIVFHYFDLSSGKMVDTKRYRDVPISTSKEK